ncbi:retrovirus-related pol polyprotein from transposon TNT 1-94 [Tanacetum coccineum]
MLIPDVLVSKEMMEYKAYKTYLDLATGKSTGRKRQTGVTIRDTPTETKKKTPEKSLKLKGMEIISDAAMLAANIKKAIKATKRDFRSQYRTGGSSEGAGSKPKVPDESKGKTKDINEGVGSKSKVLDVSTNQESEYESWGDSGDKEYNRINEELYEDVNVKLKDAKLADEGKGNEKLTDTRLVDAKHEEINQEVASAKVHNEVQATSTAAPATQKEKTEAPPSSSSRFVSSNYGSTRSSKNLAFIIVTVPVSVILEPTVRSLIPKIITKAHATTIYLFIPILTPTTTKATTLTPAVPKSKALSAIHLRVSDLEKEVKEFRNIDHSTKLLATIKSEVLTAVKEYLGKNLGDAFQKKSVADIRKTKIEHAAKQQESKYTIKSSDKAALNEFNQKQALFETMTASKSFNNHPKHMALYHALMESILANEDAMDQGVADKQKKRKHANDNREEDPPVGPDQGLKRRKTSKDVEPSKRPKSTNSSKGTTRSQPKSTSKSAQAEKIVFKAVDTDMQQNQGDDTGKQPNVKAAPKKDCFKKPKKSPTPDPEWNQGKSVDEEPTQNWLSDLAIAKKSPLTFNELMNTPIDFSVYAMNRLKISNSTKADLIGPVYNLLKGRCKSYVEIEYNMEECYKALNDQLDWNNPKRDRCPFNLSKPLPLVESRDKAAKYELKGIEDMFPMLWSPIKVTYDKHAALVTNVNVNEWYGYGHLEEIEVRRAYQKFIPVQGSDEVLKLKNFKKDGYSSFQDKEKYEHVGLKVTSLQEGKRSQDDDKRLDLADDLKEAQVHIQVKLKEQWINGKDYGKVLVNTKVGLAAMSLCVYLTTLMNVSVEHKQPQPSNEGQNALNKLLKEFQDVFAVPNTLPPHRTHDYRIVLQEGVPPVNRVIRNNHSPFSSPTMMVKKKDDTWRMCIDYRKLNKHTIKDKFPIPVIEELIDELSRAHVFSKQELRSGYHQIRMVDEDVHKTTFKTHEDHYEFLVMPFGLTNVEYLGHVIYDKGVETNPSKIEAMKSWPVLKNIKELKGFLGLAGHYRRFIKGFETISHPLTSLLKKNAFKWSNFAQEAFKQLKQAMIQTPVLALPNFDVEFVVETDASRVGLGAVLKQGGHLIAYLRVQVSLEKLALLFYWKGMSKAVKMFVRQCDICQRNKPNLEAYPGLLQPLPILSHIWKDISMDFIDGFSSSQGKTIIFVIVDILSKCLRVLLEVYDKEKPKEWSHWLSLAEYWYNTNFHININTTPFEVVYRCKTPEIEIGVFPTCTEKGLIDVEPEKMLDRRLQKKSNSATIYVLVQWANSAMEDATWEWIKDL